MDRVSREAPAALSILRVSAYLAPEGIPRTLLEHLAAVAPEGVELSTASLRKGRRALHRYALIELEEETYSVHRLVQKVVRDAMSREEQSTWIEAAVALLYEVIPAKIEVADWPLMELLLPHGEIVIEWQGEALDEKGCFVANQMGFFLHERGEYAAEEPLLKLALSARERILGPDHPHTLGSLSNVASLYRSTGRYGEAEPLCERALSGYERVHGPDHPATLRSLNNLAGLYFSTGRYGKRSRCMSARYRGVSAS